MYIWPFQFLSVSFGRNRFIKSAPVLRPPGVRRGGLAHRLRRRQVQVHILWISISAESLRTNFIQEFHLKDTDKQSSDTKMHVVELSEIRKYANLSRFTQCGQYFI
jgi:hypothetical protein